MITHPLKSETMSFDQLLYQLEHATSVSAKDRLVREFAATHTSPLIEDTRAIFFHISSEAESVTLEGDWTHWQPTAPMRYLPDTPLWYRIERFPRAARLEYKIAVNGHSRPDPHNPRTAPSGMGPHSEFAMPDYRAPREITDDTPIARGVVEPHWMRSQAMADRRTFWVCLPPGYDAHRQYPVAYLNDGGDYLHYADFPRLADYLIEAGLVKPFIAVLVKPNDRRVEYARNNHYARFLVDELVPWIDSNYATRAIASARAIIGSSFGGLIAAHVARRRPQVFGLVAGQSGYYSFQNDALIRDYSAAQNLGIKFHLVVGEFETDLDGAGKPDRDFVAAQRRFVEMLRAKQYVFAATEYPEGHQWNFWRAHLGEAFKFFWGN